MCVITATGEGSRGLRDARERARPSGEGALGRLGQGALGQVLLCDQLHKLVEGEDVVAVGVNHRDERLAVLKAGLETGRGLERVLELARLQKAVARRVEPREDAAQVPLPAQRAASPQAELDLPPLQPHARLPPEPRGHRGGGVQRAVPRKPRRYQEAERLQRPRSHRRGLRGEKCRREPKGWHEELARHFKVEEQCRRGQDGSRVVVRAK
mmetsp:Transcript_5164/g.17033  ORF Transcript_5164/g.17033 Transcript_5164/m.17033 type:complete len:211 (-) Transcript_5164:493-1125(-)